MTAQTDTQADIDALQARIDELEAQLSSRNDLLFNKEQQLQKLLLQISQLQNINYGSSSERIVNPDQLKWYFFNEAELLAALDKLAEQKAAEKTQVKAHTRKGRQSRPLPKELPFVEVVHELPEDQKHCDDCGLELKPIGEDVTEQLGIIPQTYYRIRHKRIRYACACKQCMRTAPIPAQPLPGTQASAVLLAHTMVGKYLDGLPLYRQEKIAAREGIDLPRTKLARWIIQCSAMLQVMFNLMEDIFFDHDIGQADETGLQVLKEPGRRAENKSWLWIRRGGPPDKPVVLVNYSPSRAGAVAAELLDGFEGYLVCDAYSGYHPLIKAGQILLVFCNDHARRRFAQIIKSVGKDHSIDHLIATRAVAWYRVLYALEKRIKDNTADEKYQARQQEAVPHWEAFMDWAKLLLEQGVVHKPTREALQYLVNHEVQLRRYCDDGRLPMTNIKAEHVAKTIAIPRKNFLFSDSQQGAKASAMIYSIIETARANEHNPFEYMTVLLTRLPSASCVEEFEQLLPWNITPDQVREQLKSYPRP